MRGGFRDESSNQSSGRDSARRAEAEEARPAEFDLRQRLDAAKRAKRAQDGSPVAAGTGAGADGPRSPEG